MARLASTDKLPISFTPTSQVEEAAIEYIIVVEIMRNRQRWDIDADEMLSDLSNLYTIDKYSNYQLNKADFNEFRYSNGDKFVHNKLCL